MKKIPYALAALVLASCATQPTAEMNDCLQPNRRVVVEVNGQVVKPPAKKPAAKPGDTAKPEAKPAKPEMAAFNQTKYVQGNSAFDPGSAVLKDGGKKELDSFIAGLQKRAVRVGAVIVTGHTDRFERDGAALSEARARAVADYLAAKGLDKKLMFYEGKGDKEPVPVTKFCS